MAPHSLWSGSISFGLVSVPELPQLKEPEVEMAKSLVERTPKSKRKPRTKKPARKAS